MRPALVLLLSILVLPSLALAQDRNTKVRNDREAFETSDDWIYNDLDAGIEAARESGKPLMVVFRCIPCEACQEFDDDVARRDPIIRDLLDRFVCVRIVQANDIDLTRFQFDFDQSFAVILMNPDSTIYGRYGTRSERPEEEDISLSGLRKAMEAALEMHEDYPAVKASLAGKQVQDRQARYATPRDYPSLAGRYDSRLDYAGEVARSCMHCHQVREAERLVFRTAGEPIPDEVLYPYPDPAVLGLKLDPTEIATIEALAADSIADRAGLRVGDALTRLDGQPLLSIADLQWVLHNTPASAQLPAQILRDGEALDLTLDLPEGWRRGNISWRVTSWELRRMALGGMVLDDLSDADRAAAGLPADTLALRVRRVGEYGEHATAKRSGIQAGDIITSFNGLTDRLSESSLLAHTVQHSRPGDTAPITLLRDGQQHEITLPLQ
ncbi:Trx7/PDZ domain-containing (seleno)protein [Tautonia marina]|uniref:Trx7/PDZ domain-containing (seleno)protein n=1 Tax=Tautonia marina TaxID=2653855 RepID=UPI001261037E|nr:Trx7/PDZ domain-containing (seleno)protein [Tautonia marina]